MVVCSQISPHLVPRELGFPGSLALWLLGGSANGRLWQKIEEWKEGKDSVTSLSASCAPPTVAMSSPWIHLPHNNVGQP